MFKLRRFCVSFIQCCFFIEQGVPEKQAQELRSLEKDTNNSFKNVNVTAIEFIKLNLIVIDTVLMVVGTEFEISHNGLKFSKRSMKDGCVYAGSLEKQGKCIINDIVLPEEKGVGKRHFMIHFNKELGSFFIKDLGEGLGTFVKIDRPIKVTNNCIYSFGDSHLIGSLDGEALTLRFIEGPKTDFKRSYTPDDSPVRIGRMSDCQIRFEDTSLSRYHCLFFYENKKWMVNDGDGEKPSTNGTWLFADNFFEVFDGMSFKVGETLFKAQISNDFSNFIS